MLRHGKSSWSDPTLADLDRPLAPRGERASRKIGKNMRRKKIRPSLVLCSPSLRTRQTLEAIEPSLGKGSSVELEPELYAASEVKLLERLQALPESVDSVMLIGHNPGPTSSRFFLRHGVPSCRGSGRSFRPAPSPRLLARRLGESPPRAAASGGLLRDQRRM